MMNKLLLAATVISLSGAGILLPMSVHGATLEEQINALLAQIANLQTQLAATPFTSSGDLTLGSKGAAVKALQQYLNANGAQIAASGAGSPGNETEYFGSLTKKALAKWQAANGVSPAAGYFGPRTRAKMAGTAAAPTAAPAPVSVPEIPAVSAPVETPATSVATSAVSVFLPNPFESTLKIETTYPSITLSSYGEKTLTAFKVSADEKIAITRIRFKNKGTFNNLYLIKFKLLANSDSGPVLAEADISQGGVVEFTLTSDTAKENKGLIVSGNSYYVRGYLVTHSYGAEKPYVRLDIESASDVSAYDYNDLNRTATITKNNSFPIIGPQITAF